VVSARAGGGAARGGSAAGFPRPRVSARWVAGRRFTRVRRLRLRALPAGARVQLRCRGRGCPFKRRPVAVRAGKANPGRHLARARLRPGAVLELRVTAAGGGTRILRYTIRRSARPRLARLCRAAGARAAAPCGT